MIKRNLIAALALSLLYALITCATLLPQNDTVACVTGDGSNVSLCFLYNKY